MYLDKTEAPIRYDKMYLDTVFKGLLKNIHSHKMQ